MRKFLLVVAAMAAFVVPATAKFGVHVGPPVFGHEYDRDRDYYRHRQWWGGKHDDEDYIPRCHTYWRYGERVTVCPRNW